ncbi:uncharacterized protein METZ01_LOCUS368502 [marine metagenome]|uniref:ECF transporter S component n=1 Tax=marine metagenome TaxID=408172 RepID=A0A382T2L7_9ZZZZ
MIIRIPNPATHGYINLSDTMVFTVALLFGGPAGGLAGGVGSSLADGLGGYFIWAPWTLVIKGFEGLIAGTLAAGIPARYTGSRRHLLETLVLLLAGGWMTLGYYLAGVVLLGAAAALTEIPGNLFQVGAGVVVALPLATALRRAIKQELL